MRGVVISGYPGAQQLLQVHRIDSDIRTGAGQGACPFELPVPMIESADLTEAMVYLCGQAGR
ncbi:hypothetical protein Mkiyose1665_26350 [Mycobacterium kiyosense]|uniref:Uncharacterized protein n=1 Tax=Mycobacterium kiyosense TaxID=2871094 RepID=A0A9P3Q647_9MYCO|nr:hypothetical protein [Mycobacterium kiyosense]BDE14933.1 hypothetical protein MKCMC460_37930 [Mycobacterium sp. 20KCMC460]BDB41773.1 hypothetical protein IWGMT90018_22190 [Mycobacterium kiyosense]GLB82306.1 hypothetical protein SRL2020028_15620 [Mycobacterium kiyosense]GLB89357.1 hypothetical protein SRL2020130_21740 [Mycobacterium kiyosense]GLB96010.1 hypothetical protein SRL2020226_27860 [Mycobacterium kiyosense]